MQVTPVNQYNNYNKQAPNFKGFLKFQGGKYINTTQITSILHDDVDSFVAAGKKFTSSVFSMSDGNFYAVKYLQKPAQSLIENIRLASTSPTTVVELDGVVDVLNEDSTKSIIKEFNDKNLVIIESFKKYITK